MFGRNASFANHHIRFSKIARNVQPRHGSWMCAFDGSRALNIHRTVHVYTHCSTSTAVKRKLKHMAPITMCPFVCAYRFYSPSTRYPLVWAYRVYSPITMYYLGCEHRFHWPSTIHLPLFCTHCFHSSTTKCMAPFARAIFLC